MDRSPKYVKLLAVTLFTCLINISNALFAGTKTDSVEHFAQSGFKLLIQKRFSNAETPLRKAIEHKDFNQISLGTRIQLYSMLETSLMVQEKYADYSILVDAKATMLEKNGLKQSGEYGITLLNKAESLFNLGKREEAIKFAMASHELLQALPSVDPRAVAHAKANIEQFQSNRASNQRMPKDLSRFFTDCESINKGTSVADARLLFSSDLEVGKDYFPQGVMKEIFATALPYGMDRSQVQGFERTIFIPDTNHTSDWCIVFEDKGKIELSLVSSDD